MIKTIFMLRSMWETEAFWDNCRTFFEGKGERVITTNLHYHDPARKDDRVAADACLENRFGAKPILLAVIIYSPLDLGRQGGVGIIVILHLIFYPASGIQNLSQSFPSRMANCSPA